MFPFPKYCINLSNRPARWLATRHHLRHHGIRGVQRFGAFSMAGSTVHPQLGYVGCTLSHLGALSQHRQGSGPIMVLEDDVRLVQHNNDGQHFSPAEVLAQAMQQLPPGWDMLYLGANPQAPMQRHSANLLRLTRAWCTHAMVFNDTSVIPFILNNAHMFEKIDVFLAQRVQPNFKCYITYPLIATQANDVSDVTGVANNYYDTIINNYNKYLPR